jgi:glycine cleavage system H protein
VVQVGITDHAQSELGDVVFVELPKPGATLGQGEAFGTIEAVKAVSNLLTPVAGTVTEINAALAGDPAAVNRDPYGDGWMIKLRVKNPADIVKLLDSAGYKKHVGK